MVEFVPVAEVKKPTFFLMQMLSCVKFDRTTMLQLSEIAAHLNKSVTELKDSANNFQVK